MSEVPEPLAPVQKRDIIVQVEARALEKMARLVRMAEDSCYVLQSLLNPVVVNRTVTLNGQALQT